MRMLAYNSGQVPSRYQVDRQLLWVHSRVITKGAFVEIREGRLKGMAVAVRTFRTDRQGDYQEIQKVPVASDYSSHTNEDPCNLELLRGMCHLDERLSFQPFGAHRCRCQPSHRPVLDDIRDDDQREHYSIYSKELCK